MAIGPVGLNHGFLMGMTQTMRLQFWMGLAVMLIRLALGCWLLFGAKRMRIIMARLLDSLKPIVHKDW